MQIILVHSKLKQARTLTLELKHLVIGLSAALLVLLSGSSLLSYATLKFGAVLELPLVHDLLRATTLELAEQRESQLRDHLNAMALKLGDMQARISRLDVLGERVTGLAGIEPQDFGFGAVPGRGGPAVTADARDLTLAQLQGQVDLLSADVDRRTQDMNRLESTLLDKRVAAQLMPSAPPVDEGYVGSGFGVRTDPFTGRQVRHEGIDFAAPPGTPILAAAGGVVVAAETHPEYGNMVDIDHGNRLVTRYAHALRLLVKPGDIVKRGQHIADVGTTGRSTGPHLHFEVRVDGVAHNPTKFLAEGGLRTTLAAAR